MRATRFLANKRQQQHGHIDFPLVEEVAEGN